MAFSYEPIPEESFETLEQVYTWAKNEQEHLARIPVKGYLKHGAQFLDDEYFGDESTAFKFNQSGIRSLCSFLGFRLDTLELLERQNLGTEVLNDLLAQRKTQDRLQNRELIIDEPKNVIIGIVSDSYVGYSNYQFIKDIEKLMKPKAQETSLFPQEGDFVFRGAFSVNTQMSLRFTMKKKIGVVKGRCGNKVDETELGIQLKNSMVGDASVNINYFLYRMICSNGMVAPTGFSVNRIFHSGKADNFHERLGKAFGEVTSRVGQAGKMIEYLGALEFNPELLAKMNRSEMIFDIIRGSKSQIVDKYKIPDPSREGNKEENRILHEAALINLIPELFGREYSSRVFKSGMRDNASMFDFINIFTEYAKDLSPRERIESEEKAGILADWIARNKRKFQ